jgi:hypothetical protein
MSTKMAVCLKIWTIEQAMALCLARGFEPRSASHHQIKKPTGSPVGFFLPAIASLCGFPRVIADLDRLSTPLKLGPFELSLVPFSPQHGNITRLGVRKVESKKPYTSTTYARTNHASFFLALVGKAIIVAL